MRNILLATSIAAALAACASTPAPRSAPTPAPATIGTAQGAVANLAAASGSLVSGTLTLAPGDSIGLADLADALPASQKAAGDAATWQHELDMWARARLAAGAQDLHADAKREFEQVLLQAALDHCDGHRGDAAQRLGLGRNTVSRKLGASRKRR